MKYHDKTILCLTYPEYVEVFGIETYKSDKKRDNIVTYGRGGNGSEVLIDYEALPENRKAAVLKHFGDPYKYIVAEPLNAWVKLNWNQKAFDYYNETYKLPNGLKLPAEYRDKYTTAITFLDGIIHYTSDKIALKRDFNIKMQSFWAIAGDVIKAQKVALPSAETRLKEKISKYKAGGYKFIVEAFRFGNDNSKKVKEQPAEDMLMKLIEWDNKLSDEAVAASYNLWATENGHKTITPAAVGYRRRTRDYEVVVAREGKSAAYNKYSKQTKRARASAPLMLVNSDDNVLDLYFQEISYVNGRKVTNNFWRPVMYVVIDTYNDYILGYAVGETVTIELVKAAYRNAMAHIVELTGQPHLWHQIQTDKWSIDPDLKGDLATFFKMGGQTHYFPAQVAQAKYIERVFGKPLQKVLKVFPNYSGANITAKGPNARPNTDALLKRSKDFPDKSKSPAVIEMAIHSMRHSVATGCEVSRQQQWLDAFNQSEFSKGRAITTERKLELIGVKHTPKEPLRLRVDGINFQLNKQQYSFDIPGLYFPEHTNKRVELIYDPADMSQVLVTDNKGIRFVADAYELRAGALADMSSRKRALLDQDKADKDTIAQKLQSYVTSRDERMSRAEIDAQSYLQANILTKAINHKAQKQVSNHGTTIQLPPTAITASIYDEM